MDVSKMSDMELRLEVMRLRRELHTVRSELYELREMIEGPMRPVTRVNEAEPFTTLYPFFDYRRDPKHRYVSLSEILDSITGRKKTRIA